MNYLQEYFSQIAEHTLQDWEYWKRQKTEVMSCVGDAKKWWEQYLKILKEDEIAAAKWLIDFHFHVPNQQTPTSDLQNLEIYIQKQPDFVKAAAKTALISVDWSTIASRLKNYV